MLHATQLIGHAARLLYYLVVTVAISYYPHMPMARCGYSVYWVFWCMCVCVRLRISLPRIKLAASNFAWWFIDVLGRESPISGNFVTPEAQNWTNWTPPGSIAVRWF